MALIGGEGSSVSSSAIEGRAGVSEANCIGIIGDKESGGPERPHVRDVVSATQIADPNQWRAFYCCTLCILVIDAEKIDRL